MRLMVTVFLIIMGLAVFMPNGMTAEDYSAQADKIISFSRSGKDKQAIAIYESLPEGAELSLRAMRAAAGCYWRQKRFDESQELYKRILNNRSTLHKLSDNPKKQERKPAKHSGVQISGDGSVNVGASSSGHDPKLEAELKKLREENERLQKERDLLRRRTEEKIASIATAAKSSKSGADELQAKLEQERIKREAAEKVSRQIQNSLERQKADLDKKVSELEDALKRARAEVNAIQANQLGEVEKLKSELEKEKQARAELNKKISSQLTGVQNQASVSSKEAKQLKKELKALKHKLKLAETTADAMRTSVEKQMAESDAKIEELEATLKRSRQQIRSMRKSHSSEVAVLEKQLADEKKAREELSRNATRQLADIGEAAEASNRKVAELKKKLDEATAQLKSKEAKLDMLNASIKKQAQESDNRIAELEASLKDAQNEASGLRTRSNAEITELQRKLAAEKKARDELNKKAEAQLAAATKVAEMSAKDTERLQQDLDKALADLKSQKGRYETLQKEMVERQKESDSKISTLQNSLKTAIAENKNLQATYTKQVAEMQKALSQAKREHESLVASSKEIESGLKKSIADGQAQIAKLQTALRQSQLAAKQSKEDAAKRIAASKAHSAQLEKKIAELEKASYSVKYEIACLSRSLEEARLKNAELSAKRANEEEKTSKQLKTESDRALANALQEIDRMEREYHELDMQASNRQDELLAQVDRLEKSTVTSRRDLEEVRNQLKVERALRKAIEAQSEKRANNLLDANRVLAESTEKMAKYFDDFKAGATGGKGKHMVDMAPQIAKLEEVTKSAALEVKALNQMLSDERAKHQAEMAKSKNEIMALRKQVASLRSELKELKTKAEERKAKWMADANRKLEEMRKAADAKNAEQKAAAAKSLADVNARYKQQLASLTAEVKVLHEKLKSSSAELERAKLEVGEARTQYSKLLKKSTATEEQLTARIHELESAISVSPQNAHKKKRRLSQKPSKIRTENKVASRADRHAKVEMTSQYQSIIDLAGKDKNQAIKRYEELPPDSEKPIELLKVIANTYRDKQEYNTAYKLYENILARDPDNRYAERKLVMTLFDLGRYDEALGRLSSKNKKSDSSGSEE